MGETFLTDTGIVESIKIHLEEMLSDEIKAHAVIDPGKHDLPFQVLRLLSGYQEALEEVDMLHGQLEKMPVAVDLIEEYYGRRRRMIDLTDEIAASYTMDTQPGPLGFASNHVHDYFDADRESRKKGEGGMEFDEYCCDVLDMDEPCPVCARIIEMIRERRTIGIKLGITKVKIMRLGKRLNKAENK